MAKFDDIRMKDLVKVEDPDEHGGITLVFTDDVKMRVYVGSDGKLVSETG